MMIFILGLTSAHYADVVAAVVRSLPGEMVAGLPALGKPMLTNKYAEECLETIVKFYSGRQNCFKRGLSIIVVSQAGESAAGISLEFFPFSLIKEVCFPRQYSVTGAQSSRDKNELIRLLVAEAKRQTKIKNSINTYYSSRINRTPLLLPLRHFGESQLRDVIKKVWKDLPVSEDSVGVLEGACRSFEAHFPFSKKGGSKTGNFANGRDVWFSTPGRHLHGPASLSHANICFLNGILRIGGAIEDGFHYDCTKRGDTHEGTFENCHGELVKKSGKPHLNVYPNDYVR